MSEDSLNKTFEAILGAESLRAANATGDTPKDFLYDKAESVEPAKISGYVYVTYKGVKYGPARMSWGALDGDKDKSTVLIQTNEGKWVKLWFFDKDLEAFVATTKEQD